MNDLMNEWLAQAAANLEKQSAEYEKQRDRSNVTISGISSSRTDISQKEFASGLYDELGTEIAEHQAIEKEIAEERDEYAEMEENAINYHINSRWF